MATIPSMPAANDAYQASLAALKAAHDKLDQITAATPVDWTAYNAGLKTCAACQASAQSALSVYQAAILDTPTVQDLITKLVADTKAMTDAAKALDQTAATLTTLATAATTMTSILTTILKFV
jgi:hypothetical protein